MVFYLQQTIHKNITQWFDIYATIHWKEQHVCQNVIWKIKYLEWLINMLAILSIKPYAKLISLSIIFLSGSHWFNHNLYHLTTKMNYLKGFKVTLHNIFQIPIVSILWDFWMFVTSRWNIGNLKDSWNPRIWCFLCFIHFFDPISTSIADHSLMVFYLQ